MESQDPKLDNKPKKFHFSLSCGTLIRRGTYCTRIPTYSKKVDGSKLFILFDYIIILGNTFNISQIFPCFTQTTGQTVYIYCTSSESWFYAVPPI